MTLGPVAAQARTNFQISERALSIIARYFPMPEVEAKERWLPYLVWSFGRRSLDPSGRVVKEFGPGYVLGAIRPADADDSMVVASLGDRQAAFLLRDVFDREARHLVDHDGERFSIEAQPLAGHSGTADA